jgi:D-alanyl-lipoteichoic acid acyltransferase DltB (MBOAT superfamily)
VDIYKGKVEPSKSLLDYGLYISLFPHLIAGPIQRSGSLLPQIQKERNLDGDRFFDGLMLIFSGLLRKCVIADTCALLDNAAFGGQLGPPTFWVVLIGAYAFTWQLHGDFRGYSDIARGSAQLLFFHFITDAIHLNPDGAVRFTSAIAVDLLKTIPAAASRAALPVRSERRPNS